MCGTVEETSVQVTSSFLLSRSIAVCVCEQLSNSHRVNNLLCANQVQPPNSYRRFKSLSAVAKKKQHSVKRDQLAAQVTPGNSPSTHCTNRVTDNSRRPAAATHPSTIFINNSLPHPANENKVIVTYLFRWRCLLRREDTKLSSFEVDIQL